ncbi:hypothetical protein [Candidatus Nitrosacidococcus tergens]|uniref:Uncharacterized protein n=1 Tax=Candidatus Nitrosacidococcus tergens TaxID=553981 RepID=A0A7G1QB60_9GAMM|nr:hypothetical protein [Candidatus Nitrosacidococcus tergens]CAB1277165.1 exported protein of unknown function [Candidatus Nitrosacidococcus tergens]
MKQKTILLLLLNLFFLSSAQAGNFFYGGFFGWGYPVGIYNPFFWSYPGIIPFGNPMGYGYQKPRRLTKKERLQALQYQQTLLEHTTAKVKAQAALLKETKQVYIENTISERCIYHPYDETITCPQGNHGSMEEVSLRQAQAMKD